MTKRMLIDDTHPEETRVVVVNGNKLEDVEFESSFRKQIKGNVYLAKVVRVEPSLQAAFVDYGGNKHGFLAFGEIHPDYYNVSDTELAEVEKEVDEFIEGKKQALKEKELQREKAREERESARAIEEQKKLEAQKTEAEKNEESSEEVSQETQTEAQAETVCETEESSTTSSETDSEKTSTEPSEETPDEASDDEQQKNKSRRLMKKNHKNRRRPSGDKVKVSAEATGTEEEKISEDEPYKSSRKKFSRDNEEDEFDDDEDDDDDEEQGFNDEVLRKLMISRKLFHRKKIQEVIKEGQIVVVQVVKEERGNKGAALSTYLSLAGRYCVLMPNRIKSGGVSRKITNGNDRKRLKNILKELPLTSDMSMIVRTAGEEKSKEDICRDYNYLMRTWNQIRHDSLKSKAPTLIYEEANLIKRSLRDMYTKDVSEVIVDGAKAYQLAREFIKILSPQSLKKIKTCRENDIPLFQRFQVEGQLEKLHDTTVQLESGGYLVINPTEALVAIDVNSGRSTREKDLEETALKTNLEAADEIARQLRLRNLAGLVVVDFIDMDENANNQAVERRIKEALKKDRSRVQVGKMSIFGLIEISRQRMHPSFFETSYEPCPHCLGKGIIRTVESSAISVLREIEAEGIKNRFSSVNVYIPSNIAIYILNNKREVLVALENKYNMTIIISADDSIKNVAGLKIERTKSNGNDVEEKAEATETVNEPEKQEEIYWEENNDKSSDDRQNNNNGNRNNNNNNHRRKNRYNNRRRFENRENGNRYEERRNEESGNGNEKKEKKGKSTWWRKLIGG
ncbi:MAG: Rne/Rng family ribonuclease [Alphaproteobacteria bacterium]|nr:Rne/Rng family ribonuclease [Alphaproteobacteria bacterium]